VNRAIDRDARERGKQARLKKICDRFSTLSPREYRVLQHVVQGKLNKQIASDLDIHERTVKLHRTAIKTKLNVDSTAELTKLWLEFSSIQM
jgi:FixJ family two-component response regulator